MRLPNFCNRPTPRAPCRSFGSRITALLGFRRGAGLPRRPPGRNLGGQCDRVQPRLTPRPKLWRGLRTSSVSRGAKPRPVLMNSSRSSPGGAPSSRRCRPGAKVVILPLTLSLCASSRSNRSVRGLAMTVSVRRAVKRRVLHRSRAPSIGGTPSAARFCDASLSSASDFCNLCDLRAQPWIA
jgi:hypothetical protein